MTERTILALLAAGSFALAGCQSSAPNPSSMPNSPSTPGRAIPGAPGPTPAPDGTSGPAPAKPVPKPPTEDQVKELHDQLNFEEEGGSRGAGYDLWVHVSNKGHADPGALVGAVNAAKHLVASAHTNPDGDALLVLPPGPYRLVAKHGRAIADESIVFTKGNSFDLTLHPATGRLPF